MRITCPNCTAHFEIPAEMLGKKGRSLKCASCGHSWYQTAEIETLDLADIMGKEYAERTRAEIGGGVPLPPTQAAIQAQKQRQAQIQMRQAVAAQQAPPGGPVSLRQGPAGAVPGQARAAAPQMGAAVAPGMAPGAPRSMMQPGAQGGPQAAQMAQSLRGQAGAAPVGDAAVSWQQGAVGAPPGMAPGAPRSMMQPGAQGGPQAAHMAQSIRGQAGAAPVGDAAVSWRQGAAGAPGMAPHAAPHMGQSMMAPGAQGGPQAAQMAQSIRGQAGAAPVGDAAVSWRQDAPGAPATGPQVAQSMRAPGAQGGPGQTAQSLMGQAGAGAVGDAAVSWSQGQAPGAGGQPGQSMRAPGAQGGPGQQAQSLMGQAGAQGGPGQPAKSLLDGQQKPAQPGQSMQAGAAGGPGQPGQSMMQAGAAGGPAAAGGPGQAASAGADAGAAGGPKAVKPEAQLVQMEKKPPKDDPQLVQMDKKSPKDDQQLVQMDKKSPKDDSQLVQMDKKSPKDGPQLVAEDPKKKKDDPQLVQGGPKPEAGAAGGPTKAAEGEAEEMWAAKKKDDEELVDPNADRPDFASKPGKPDAEEEEDDFGDFDGEDDSPKVKVKRAPRRANMAYFSAGIMGFAVILVGATLWFGRGTIEKMWPNMKKLYETVDIGPERPGEGLKIGRSVQRLTRIGGVETLVVKGFVSNTTAIVKEVPKLSLQLINEKKEVIQSAEAPAPAPLLNPGQSVEYEVRLELPQLDRAKDFQVVWVE